MKQIYECYIQTLSPLHIGCDEVYEPMGFVVKEAGKELISFDPVSFIGRLNTSEKQRFSAICTKGTVESLLEIYKFLKGRPAAGKRVQLCDGFVNHYNKTLAISSIDKRKVQQELGKFVISRTSFLSGDGRPYIPGSSVKGSLRTAYLNHMAENKPMPTPGGKFGANDLEKKLLNYSDLAADPFRLVKVSDFMPVGNIVKRIIYAIDVKKSTGTEAKGPFQILETILPGAVFRGSIFVEEPLSPRAVRETIQLKALLLSSRIFYAKEYDREKMELQTAGAKIPNNFFNEGSIPIRIGRHSGAESVTIGGHRKIKILAGSKSQAIEMDHATTFWLTSETARPHHIGGCKPFGWGEITELTPLKAQEFEDTEKARNSESEALEPGVSELSHMATPGANLPGIGLRFETGKQPELEIWEKACITYAPNTKIVTAKSEGKTAITLDISLVPEAFVNKLIVKKKAITASVKAELIGGREYLLIEISG